MVTHRLDVVEVYLDLVAHAIGNLLKLVHVLQLGLVARLGCGAAILVVDHVVVILGAIAVQVEALELVRCLGRGGLVVFEEINKGSYAVLAKGGQVLCTRMYIHTFLLIVVDGRTRSEQRHGGRD